MSGPLVDEALVGGLAQVAGLTIDPDHLPGVMRNLATLLDQAALFMDGLDPVIEPAAAFRP